MSKRKIYIVRSSMCKQTINYFDMWSTYGAFTSMKLVNQELDQAFSINKGTDLLIRT